MNSVATRCALALLTTTGLVSASFWAASQSSPPLQPLSDSIQLISADEITLQSGATQSAKTYIVMLAGDPVVSYEGVSKATPPPSPARARKLTQTVAR